jgi:hypothetical protein
VFSVANTSYEKVDSSDVQLWLTGFQLNVGSKALPYVRNQRSIAAELEAVQRYYETSYPLNVQVGTNGTTGAERFSVNTGYNSAGYRYVMVPFKVKKRITPTFCMWDATPVGGCGSARKITTINASQATVSNNITPTDTDINDTAVRVRHSCTASESGFIFHWAADARL